MSKKYLNADATIPQDHLIWYSCIQNDDWSDLFSIAELTVAQSLLHIPLVYNSYIFIIIKVFIYDHSPFRQRSNKQDPISLDLWFKTAFHYSQSAPYQFIWIWKTTFIIIRKLSVLVGCACRMMPMKLWLEWWTGNSKLLSKILILSTTYIFLCRKMANSKSRRVFLENFSPASAI